MSEEFKTAADRPQTSLLDLTREAARLEDMLMEHAESNGGEVNPNLENFLAEIEANIATKVDNYQYVMDRLEATATALALRAKKFNDASDALCNARDRMKDRIKVAMHERGLTEVAGRDIRFRLTSTKGRLVVDSKKIPHELMLVKTVTEPDRERIRTLIESGQAVEGAEIQPGFQLRSYVNKDKK